MTFVPKESICVDCHKKIIKTSPRQVRCRECQQKRREERAKERLENIRAERQKEAYADMREQQRLKDEMTPHVCTKSKTCKYGGMITPSVPCCDYMLIKGHRRPCPPKECTEYKKRGKNEKSIQNNFDGFIGNDYYSND